MKLLTFHHGDGLRVGALTEAGVVDLSARLPAELGSIRAILEQDALGRARDLLSAPGPVHDPDALTFATPVPDASKILCIGVNYAKIHPVTKTATPPPPQPVVFMRTADSLVAHRAPLERPPEDVSVQFDFEAEVAAIIGRPARHVSEADALAHVAGYTCFNDGSVRDWQKHGAHAGKNFHRSGSWGPYLATADEISDPMSIALRARLNGHEMQRTTTDQMIFALPAIIAYLSRFTLLRPGDVVATGSPTGTGASQDPPRFLTSGDRVEVEVEGVGILMNPVG